MQAMTKRERVMAAVKGEPIDHVPVSFFGHRHAVEMSPDSLAAHLLHRAQQFGWDFIKVQLRASYYQEAWGCKYQWDPESGPQMLDYVVKRAKDFHKLRRLDPSTGVLGNQVQVAKLLHDAVAGEIPYIQTIFCPLTIVNRLAGARPRTESEPEVIKRLIEEDSQAVHLGLTIVSETIADYARESIRAGADGIFMTTTVWSGDTISPEDYNAYGKPYDLVVYRAAIKEGATLNILHMCRENILFDLMSDYPVEIFNFDALSPRNPSISEALETSDKAFWGGIDHKDTLLNGPKKAIESQVHSALNQTMGRRFLLGPGCAIPPEVPDFHLLAVKQALSTWYGG